MPGCDCMRYSPPQPRIFIDGDPPNCNCGLDCEMPCWQRVGLTADPCRDGHAPCPAALLTEAAA